MCKDSVNNFHKANLESATFPSLAKLHYSHNSTTNSGHQSGRLTTFKGGESRIAGSVTLERKRLDVVEF